MSIRLAFRPKRVALAIATALFSVMAIGPVNAQYYDEYDYNNGYYDDRYDNGDYQMFYDELAPHGTWLLDPTYGYVWSPRVGKDFRPYYTNGRWVMTDLGNMWVSGYVWGAIPFHYGRWVYNPFYGWLWVPGRVWAPAWVVWRAHSSYYGWAPMGPGVSITFNFGNYYTNHYDYWTFVPCNYLYGGNYHRYRRTNININFFRQTTVINYHGTYHNTRFFAGPRVDDIRRVTGKSVKTFRISEVNTRGRNTISGNTVRVYNPRIGTTNRPIAPRSVSRIEDRKRTKVDDNIARNFRNNVHPNNRINDSRTINERQNRQTINRDNVRNNNRNQNFKNERSIQLKDDKNNGVQKQMRTVAPKDNHNIQQNNRVAPRQQSKRDVSPQRIDAPKQNKSIEQRQQPKRVVSPQRQSTPRQEMRSKPGNNINMKSAPTRSSRPEVSPRNNSSRPDARTNNAGRTNSRR